jgi:hypothetical protein
MKPSASQVKNWVEEESLSNPSSTVYSADTEEDFYKVIGGGKTKYFYGETAWQDAERFASDIYFKSQRES